ncbi:RNA-directed DNA polymerase from mobile element jockey [Trichonephila clavipes]|nr:RNA-directed DNA polymerase from mobile element jockey [Trichonephila clavipes]
MDATAVQIKINNFPPINVVSAYVRRRVGHSFPVEDFKKIFNSGSNCIIAGDYNAAHVNWHNAKSTRFGQVLHRLIRDLRGAKLVAPQTATHLQPRQRFGSVIDLAVFKHIPFNHSVRVINDLSSDHYPVILEINLITSIIKNPEQLSTNWFNFKFALNKKPLPTVELTSNDNIELAISELNQNFTEAFVEASKPKFNNAPKILSPEIKFKIYQRNRLRKFWQRTRCPSIYSQFRTLSREIAKDIQAYSRVQWEKHIEALSPIDNTLWRKSSFLRKPFQSIPPLKGALGSIAITPQELAEQSKILQAQIDAWGLPPKPINAPFQVVLHKKGRKATETEDEGNAKKQRTDITSTENRFAQLSVEEMDIPVQAGTSTQNEVPGAAAPRKKHHVPPITIDNVSNQAGLLKHLQDLTKLKLEAKLIGSKLRIFPQTAYAYHLIRKYVEENSLESYTYILPEEKKLRLVIRGLPTDMSPIEIIGSLAGKNITVNECHIMTSKKTGKDMPLFLISMDKTEENKAAYHVTEIGYMKVKIEPLRPKYGPPQCFRCRASSTPADSALAHPDANPRNKPENAVTTNKTATKPVKTTFTTPPPPKVNFWEQRAKNSTPLQQPNPSTSKKPSQATSPAAPSTVESAEDLFEQLNSPAVRETFDLLEEFIKIATTIPTKSNLTVISWNANGIRSRVEEFRSFIADWNPDIVNLQETHLQPCHNFIFPDYNIYRTDRTFRGGGTAIMIKRSIPHHQIFITNNSLETTAIQLIRQNDQPVTIVSAYRPPRKPFTEQDLHRIFRNQGYVLVAGDLNAKHASWSPHTQQNTPGNIIRRFCDRTGYSLAPRNLHTSIAIQEALQ